MSCLFPQLAAKNFSLRPTPALSRAAESATGGSSRYLDRLRQDISVISHRDITATHHTVLSSFLQHTMYSVFNMNSQESLCVWVYAVGLVQCVMQCSAMQLSVVELFLSCGFLCREAGEDIGGKIESTMGQLPGCRHPFSIRHVVESDSSLLRRGCSSWSRGVDFEVLQLCGREPESEERESSPLESATALSLSPRQALLTSKDISSRSWVGPVQRLHEIQLEHNCQHFKVREWLTFAYSIVTFLWSFTFHNGESKISKNVKRKWWPASRMAWGAEEDKRSPHSGCGGTACSVWDPPTRLICSHSHCHPGRSSETTREAQWSSGSLSCWRPIVRSEVICPTPVITIKGIQSRVKCSISLTAPTAFDWRPRKRSLMRQSIESISLATQPLGKILRWKASQKIHASLFYCYVTSEMIYYVVQRTNVFKIKKEIQRKLLFIPSSSHLFECFFIVFPVDQIVDLSKQWSLGKEEKVHWARSGGHISRKVEVFSHPWPSVQVASSPGNNRTDCREWKVH